MCGNCLNTLPYVKQWHERYGRTDSWWSVCIRRSCLPNAIRRTSKAVERYGIPYPVALDPHMPRGRRTANRYWPALYLIDRQGHVVYRHIGEGDICPDRSADPDAARRIRSERGPTVNRRTALDETTQPSVPNRPLLKSVIACADLRFAVHHERPVADDRLVDRLAAQDQQRRVGVGLDRRSRVPARSSSTSCASRATSRAVDQHRAVQHDQRERVALRAPRTRACALVQSHVPDIDRRERARRPAVAVELAGDHAHRARASGSSTDGMSPVEQRLVAAARRSCPWPAG